MATHGAAGSRPASRYEHLDFFLLRAPALPVEAFRELTDVSGTADDAERRARARACLRRLAARPDVRRALVVASRDLVDALPRLDRDPDAIERKTRRVYSRLLRYLTRMAVRPTPFGGFSGVALGRFGSRTTLRLGRCALGESRISPDMGWLLGLIKKLESDPAVRAQLDVTVNSSVHVVGDRLVLPVADVYGERDTRAVRIRRTAAVDAVLRLTAAASISFGELVDGLRGEFPHVPPARVVGLLEEMWQLNVLTSTLRPPLTTAFPERFVAEQLTGIAATGATATALQEILELARRAAGGGDALLDELDAAARALVPAHTGTTYRLDSALDLRTGTLSDEVGRTLATAVDTLMRLSAAVPGHNHHLARYREAFTERYGPDALVPVLEVLSPDHGLDAPPTYVEPVRTAPLPPSTPPDPTDYDRVLTELVAEAWWQGRSEVELTDGWLDRLAPPPADGAPAMPIHPAVDVYAQLHRGPDDQARERWRVVLREDVLACGGRTYGRFCDLLDGGGTRALRGFARREEALSTDVVHAELAYLPGQGRAANVTLRPQLREYEIVINAAPTVPPDRVLALDDLLVGATDDRFFLWSRRLGREVVVTQSHMLSPQLAPNVARFLLEASHDGYVVPTGFRWGSLGEMPYLPRVVRGDAVLHPAQWTVTADALAAPDAVDFAAAVRRWRERWAVPRHVHLVDEDNRLLLDLEHPVCRDELERELARGPRRATVHEVVPGLDGDWLTDARGRTYVGEVVVPLVARDPADVARSAVPASRLALQAVNPPHAGRRHLPGGEWTSLKIYAAFSRHDEIIASAVREEVAALRERGLVDRWFYLRYADPQPHLRVRFRGRGGRTPPELLARLTAWTHGLVGRGLAYDVAVSSYAPEIERYGGPRTFPDVERLFAANSDVTADLVALLYDAPGEMEPTHVAVAAVDTLFAQWGLDRAARLDFLPAERESDDVRSEFRGCRDYLCELIAPGDVRPHVRGRAHHERLRPVLAAQADAVGAAARAVRAAQAEGASWSTTATVVGSLAHMQVNRLMDPDPHREARCYALWGHTLRTLRGRPAGRRPSSGLDAGDRMPPDGTAA